MHFIKSTYQHKMFAIQFISNETFPLKKSDSAESALLFMNDWKVNELPVVEGGKVLGFVRESLLLDKEDKKVEFFMDINAEIYCISEHMHVFEIINRMQQYQLNSLAVMSADKVFLGIICAKDISAKTYENSSLTQLGSILVLEVPAIHYSLAEISRICESNDAKIIHLMIESLKDENNTLHVSLKLNKEYLNFVMASLERYGYKIIFTNSPFDPNQSFDDRYNWLIKYLNS